MVDSSQSKCDSPAAVFQWDLSGELCRQLGEIEEVVFRFEDGKAVKTLVTTGISDFERIEILSGLEKGDKVISGPFLAVSKRLKDGDNVASKSKEEDESDDEDEGATDN